MTSCSLSMNASWPPPHLHQSCPFIKHLGHASPGRVRQQPPTEHPPAPRGSEPLTHMAFSTIKFYVSQVHNASQPDAGLFTTVVFRGADGAGSALFESVISPSFPCCGEIPQQTIKSPSSMSVICREQKVRRGFPSGPPFLADSHSPACPPSGCAATLSKTKLFLISSCFCLTAPVALLSDSQSLSIPRGGVEGLSVTFCIKTAIVQHNRFAFPFFPTSRITIRFTKPCRGAAVTHTGRVWLWDVSLPCPCQSIVQLKYTTATQPWTILKEPRLHCLPHLNTSVNTRFTFSCRAVITFNTAKKQHFPVLCCHLKPSGNTRL